MSLINRLTSHLDGPAIVESMRVQVVRCDEGEALFFGAQAAERMGWRELAGRWLRYYLVIDPSDRRGAARDLERLGMQRRAQALSDQYIAGLFDYYAPMFDQHLVEKLEYSAPQTLERMLAMGYGTQEIWARRAVDLGCGTGLCGLFMRQRCQRLEGVDLAPRMVEAARARGIYDHLEVGEVAHYLAAGPADCDLIVAADVTTYIGDLAPLFTAMSAALTPGGRFAATFSDMAEGTFAIGEAGTYRHNSDYIDALAKAAGLTVDVIEKGAIRKEAKRPLSTLFYVFRRSDR